MRRLLPLALLFGCFESYEAAPGPTPDAATLEIRLVAEEGALGEATAARARVDGEVAGETSLTRAPVDLAVARVETSLGTHDLELELVGADGAVTLRRTASVLVRGDQAFTFTLESACASVRCAAGERCRDGRCEPECPGPGCPECDCTTSADCPPSTGCTISVCRDCVCVTFDDDGLCDPPALCSEGSCVADDCACMADGDCPELPEAGCGRAVCRECACTAIADVSRCAPGEVCDPETFACVSTARLRVVLRTDYAASEFRRVRTRIDGDRPIVHVPEPDADYVAGVTVASAEVSFGVHEVVLELVGTGQARRRRVEVREDTAVSLLVLRPTP